MIRQEIIDKILDRVDIVQIIGEQVKLRKSGTRYVGLCPFHKEKTGSFYVSPHTGTYKCFGCGKGGNAITFFMEHDSMTFVEAVKALAQRTHVEIEEEQESVEAKQNRLHREALWIANKQVADFYRKQFLQSKEAQDYAFNRWGRDYCNLKEIGWAPDGPNLQRLPVKMEFLKELGLINRGGYDFYQNRIVIQIHDRFGHVIGFTARCMGEQHPKYLNSSESLIFHKSKVLFGIEDAWKTAAKQDKMFLVEGAPDCMRLQSIGVYNTVAALGSAWNETHFSTIKRIASKVCFLPDADPPKNGETFGHGVKVAIEAATLAMECGMSVSIKEIPDNEEGNKKQDPDTYFTNTNIFNSIEEVDFILWLAEKLFPHNNTTEEQRQSIKQIAYLLSLLNDETGVSMYINKLTKYYQGRRLWLQAVDKERKLREEQSKKTHEKDEDDLNRKYGFYIDHGCYMSITEKGSVYEWSNFTMLPLFHIKDTTNPKRLYKIKNSMGHEEILELKQEDLIALAKFKQRIEGLGNFIWKGTEKELTKLKSYIYEKTETATEITQMGWQRAGFYAFGNGVFYDNNFIKTDDFGIVRLKDKGNYYLPSSSTIYKNDLKLFTFEKQFVHLDLSSVTLKEFTQQLFKVYGDNGREGFCFYLATLFRDVVTSTSANHWFPILNLFGPKGSGKSELGHTLLSLFTISYTAPNIQNSTASALNDTVAQSANALAHIDEYKNDIDPRMIEFLKGLWDGTGRTRMNMDLDKKKETTAVDSGIILSGQEMPTSDIALFTRLIFLQFPRSEFTDAEKQNYKKLLEMRSLGLTHLTLEILKQRKHFEQAWSMAFLETQKLVGDALGREKGEDRIMNNWCVPLAALRVLQNIIPTLTYDEMLNVTIEGIKKQNGECKTNGELGNFWNVVQYLASDGELVEGGDFFIKCYSMFKTDIINATWQTKRPILFLQKSRIFNLYRKEGRQANEKVLPTDALKYYLQNSSSYLGEKVARFDVYKKGILQYDHARQNGSNTPPKMTVTQRAFCFDYDVLCETFGISLWTSKDEPEDETPF